MSAIVHRKRGKPWVFKWRSNWKNKQWTFGQGYYHRARKNIYRIQIETYFTPVEISIKVFQFVETTLNKPWARWADVTGKIGAIRIELPDGTWTWK